MMSTLLAAVTGATGFLGRPLCEALSAGGWRVRALQRDATSWPEGIEPVRISGLSDARALQAAFAGAEAVIHLAARVHVMRDTAQDPLQQYRQVNVDGTRQVLAAARRAGVKRVVIASSVKAVGEGNTAPWTEATEPRPVDPYGISKLESERVALSQGLAGGPEVTVLRFPLIYGPGVRANGLRLLRMVAWGIPLPFGRVRNRRSFLYVGNAVAAVRAVLAAPAAAGETFFVSDGVDLSTPELVQLLAGVLGRRARLFPVPERLFRLAGRAGDVVARVLPVPLTTAAIERMLGSLTVDSSRLRECIGFVPPFTPEQGWARTAEWYRQRRVA